MTSLDLDVHLTLMRNQSFIKLYQSHADLTFKTKGIDFGIWFLCTKNGIYGIIDENGNWCWRNTINTHPKCFFILHKIYYEHTGNILDFSNNIKWNINLKKLWLFISENFELIFIKNTPNGYYREMERLCSISWGTGIITTIAVLYNCRDIFSPIKIKTLEFDVYRGNLDDMFKKIDFKFNDKSVQVKSGKGTFDNEIIHVNGSPNDLKSEADYYTYVDIVSGSTTILTFKNIRNKITPHFSIINFDNDLLISKITKEMKIPEILMEILTYCGRNDIIFNIENIKEKENYTYYQPIEKRLEIGISDFKSDNLESLLLDCLERLKNLSQ